MYILEGQSSAQQSSRAFFFRTEHFSPQQMQTLVICVMIRGDFTDIGGQCHSLVSFILAHNNVIFCVNGSTTDFSFT